MIHLIETVLVLSVLAFPGFMSLMCICTRCSRDSTFLHDFRFLIPRKFRRSSHKIRQFGYMLLPITPILCCLYFYVRH